MADAQAQIQQAAARNADLLRALAETDYAAPALREQNRYLDDLRTQLRVSDDKLRNLDKKRAAELKDHEKYRDSHMKRFVYKAAGKKDKFEQRAVKEEREYFEVLQMQHQEKQINDNLKEQISEATGVQQQFQDAARRHDSLQTELDQMYHAIFSGPTPQFPDEDEKEQASDRALQAYHETRTKAEAETRAVQLLMQAMYLMNGAIGSMDQALSHSRMDMFGGGAMMDMMERNALSQAERMIQQARLKHANAKHASGGSISDLPRVNINHGSLFTDVFFDNIFTDMAFHDEIKRGRAEVLRCASVLKQQGERAKQRLAGFQEKLVQDEMQLTAARKALQRARELAFERVANGQTVAAGPSAPPPVDESDAPPAYVP